MAKSASLSSEDLIPASSRKQQAARQRGVVPSDELVPMQFRMPPEFAQAFRMEAVRRNMKYNQLLQECFELLMKSKGNA